MYEEQLIGCLTFRRSTSGNVGATWDGRVAWRTAQPRVHIELQIACTFAFAELRLILALIVVMAVALGVGIDTIAFVRT